MAACRESSESIKTFHVVFVMDSLCSAFRLSSNFYLAKGFTLCCPLSHVVRNSCPMGCLKPQLLRPLVTEVAATKGSVGDRDLEKKDLASAAMLWPLHRWSASLSLCFVSLNVFQRQNLEGGSNSTRIILKCYSLCWEWCKGEEEYMKGCCWKHKRPVSEISAEILWSLGKKCGLKGRKKPQTRNS